MTPGRDQFICKACDEPADEDEAPSYCPNCGWDGLTYAFGISSVPSEVTT